MNKKILNLIINTDDINFKKTYQASFIKRLTMINADKLLRKINKNLRSILFLIRNVKSSLVQFWMFKYSFIPAYRNFICISCSNERQILIQNFSPIKNNSLHLHLIFIVILVYLKKQFFFYGSRLEHFRKSLQQHN